MGAVGAATDTIQVKSLKVDGAGNVYVAGTFTGTAGIGPFNMTSAGDSDAFVTKLNANGSFLWANRYGDASKDTGVGVDVDAAGNVYTLTTRTPAGSIFSDPGQGQAYDIVKYNSTGSTAVDGADRRPV